MIREPANARSRRTREALLDAAVAILREGGFPQLTMTAVAERAAVTRRAVYLHFETRADLVAALFDHVAGAEGLQESLARVWAAESAGAALDAWARHLGTYHRAVLPIDRAVRAVAALDVDAAAHARRVSRERLASCRRLSDRLAADGALAEAWTPRSAADMLYALSSSDVVEGLLVDRRLSIARFQRQLSTVLRHTFLPGAAPAGA